MKLKQAHIIYQKLLRTISQISVLTLLCVVMSTHSYATHIVGGDMSYRCIGNDVYEITVTVRRDCENGLPTADFDDPLSIGIFDPVTNDLLDVYGDFGQILIPFSASDTLNETISSDCGFIGTQVCVQQATYKTNITLPFRNNGFLLAYQRCCRNITINNIVEPLEVGSTYHVTISPQALQLCNSSPAFNSWPDIYICTNLLHSYDHSATDIDGDSLVYKLCVPNAGADVDDPLPQPPNNPPFGNVTYQSPFGLDDLIGGNTPLTIDPNTGMITAIPGLVGQYLIGVCVEEYRNGILLSTVKRDFQYNVRVCGVAPVSSFDIEPNECGSLERTFINNSTDANSYLWTFDHPTATLSSTETNPTFLFPELGTYIIKLDAIRDIDQCRTSYLDTISITENEISSSFDVQIMECLTNGYAINLVNTSSNSDANQSFTEVQWTIILGNITNTYTGSTVQAMINSEMDFTITLDLISSDACSASLTQSFVPSDLLGVVDFNSEFIDCSDGGYNIILSDASILNNAMATSWQWLVIDGDREILANVNPFALEVVNIDEIVVQLEIGLDNGCSLDTQDSLDLGTMIPTVDFEIDQLSCEENSFQLALTDRSIHNGFTPLSYEWIISNANGVINTQNGVSTTITVENENTIDIRLNINYAESCTFSKIINGITNNNIITPTVIQTEIEDCTSDGSVELVLNAVFDDRYNVEFNNWTVSVNGQTPTIASGNSYAIMVDTGDNVEIMSSTMYANGCMTSSLERITIEGVSLQFVSDPIVVCPGQTSPIVQNPNPNWTYTWSPTTGLAFGNTTSDFSNPTFVGNSSTNYSVTVSNGLCDVVSSIQVDVTDQFDLSISGETNICDNNVELQVTGAPISEEYIWSLAPDFGSILFSGSVLRTTQDIGDVSYYVRTNSEDSTCVSTIDSIVVSNQGLTDLVFGDNIEVCPNDIFQYAVMSSSNQAFDIVFEDDPHIIAGINTANPTISIGTNETENFTLAYTATNEAGCSSSEEVLFILSSNQELSFISEETCGTLEVCFVNTSSSINAFQFFNFGDGSPLVEANNTCHTYATAGDYTVTLSSNLSFCPGIEFSTIIEVDGKPDLSIEGDTVICDGMVTLLVSGAINGDTYEWSTDASFTTIIATTARLNTTLVSNTQTYFVRTGDNASCPSNIASVEVINSTAINLDLINPFEVCRGDVFNYSLDIDPMLISEISWTSDPHIISGLNTIQPLISIDDNETENFNLSFNLIDINGCSAEYVVEFVLIETPTLSFNYKQQCGTYIVCFKNTSSTISSQQLFDFGDGSPPVSAADTCYEYASSGMYEVRLFSDTDICDSATDATQLVTITSSIPLSIEGDTIACDNRVDLSVSGAPIGFDYEWSTELNFNNIIATGPSLVIDMIGTSQTYYVQLVNNINCLSEIDSITVQDGFFDVNFDTPFTICQGDTIPFTIFPDPNVMTDIVWTPHPNLIDNLDSTMPTVGVDILQSGSFTLSFTATSKLGCTRTLDVEFEIMDNPHLSFEFGGDCRSNTICFTNTTVDQVGLYAWNFGDGSPEVIAGNTCHTYQEQGEYIVSLFNIMSTCQGIPETHRVRVPSEANLAIDGNTLICDGQIDLQVSGGLAGEGYKWSDSPDFSTILSTNDRFTSTLLSDSLTLYVMTDDDATCRGMRSITVYNGSLDLSFASQVQICPGDEFQYPITTTDATAIFNWEASSFIISGINTNNPTIQIPSGAEGSIALSFTAQNEAGCSESHTVVIEIVEKLQIDFSISRACGTREICFTPTILGQEQYTWDFGDGSPSAMGEQICHTYTDLGQYDIVLSSENSICQVLPITKAVGVIDTEALSLSGDALSCDGFTNIMAMTGTSTDQFIWSDNINFNTIISTVNPLMVEMSQDTQTFYVVTDENASCFSSVDSFTVINASIDVSFADTVRICSGQSVFFPVMNNKTEYQTTIQFADDPHVLGNSNTFLPSIGARFDETGEFTITFTITNEIGCQESFSALFIISSSLTMDFDIAIEECGTTSICFINNNLNSNVQYFWDFGDTSSSMDTSSLFNPGCYTYPGPGIYDVTLTANSVSCGTMENVKQVIIPEQLDIMVSNTNIDVCRNEDFLITATESGGAELSYCLMNGSVLGTGESLIANFQNDTTILVKATDILGCSDTVSIFVDIFDFDLIPNGPDVVVCAGTEFEISITNLDTNGNYSYQWMPAECIVSGGDTSNPIMSTVESKDMTVVVTNNDLGCSTSVAIPVEVSSLDINIFPDIFGEIKAGAEIVLSVSGLNGDNLFYEWSNDPTINAESQTVSPIETTTYTVTVTDEFACTGTASYTIEVREPLCNEEDIFVPSAFTPNGDGINDIMFVRSAVTTGIEFKIIDRWGKELFLSRNVNTGWDGTFEGVELPPDAYAFFLTATCINDSTFVNRGNISLLR